jgi:two-component system, OmpR family, response regulator
MPTRKTRILLVDDETITTHLLRLNLEQTGVYEVREVNDSKLALDAARQFNPDLILLDVIMPELDGGDVVSRLKEDSKLKNTPIVFVTAVAKKDEVSKRGGVIGGFPFIAKPFSAEEIIACIEKHLNA